MQQFTAAAAAPLVQRPLYRYFPPVPPQPNNHHHRRRHTGPDTSRARRNSIKFKCRKELKASFIYLPTDKGDEVSVVYRNTVDVDQHSGTPYFVGLQFERFDRVESHPLRLFPPPSLKLNKNNNNLFSRHILKTPSGTSSVTQWSAEEAGQPYSDVEDIEFDASRHSDHPFFAAEIDHLVERDFQRHLTRVARVAADQRAKDNLERAQFLDRRVSFLESNMCDDNNEPATTTIIRDRINYLKTLRNKAANNTVTLPPEIWNLVRQHLWQDREPIGKFVNFVDMKADDMNASCPFPILKSIPNFFLFHNQKQDDSDYDPFFRPHEEKKRKRVIIDDDDWDDEVEVDVEDDVDVE